MSEVIYNPGDKEKRRNQTWAVHIYVPQVSSWVHFGFYNFKCVARLNSSLIWNFRTRVVDLTGDK